MSLQHDALPRSVGRTRVTSGGTTVHGTGFLIAPTRVLTCAHCLRAPGAAEGAKSGVISFTQVRRPAEPPTAPEVPFTVAFERYDRAACLDVAVLDLESPVEGTAFLRLSDDDPAAHPSWETFGHPATTAHAPVFLRGTVDGPYVPPGAGADAWILSLEVNGDPAPMEGMSGAPILTEQGVIGILTVQLYKETGSGADRERSPAFSKAFSSATRLFASLPPFLDATGGASQVLIAHRASPKSQTTGSTPTAPDVHIARLPATGRDLFGRETELAWLDTCWNEGVRVASIVAFGGVGKSSLVNEWLQRMDRDGWRGATRVYGWSFYSQGTDRLASSDELFSDALRRFGDTEPPPMSPWDKGERLAALVRKERALLILDGVEPLQWGPGVEEGKLKDPALMALVKELGAQNMGLCVITSRVALTDMEGVGGDKVRAKELNNLSPEAGAELLEARGAKGTEEEMMEAVREYNGHGLALTLLGSYLADVADGDVRRRKEIGPLEEDERVGGHARRVMTAYEKWLGKPEVAILHMIGLFERPADEDEITALRAEPVVPGLTDALVGVDGNKWKRAVAKLGRVGLLAEQDDKRLDAHPLVRQHFGEQLKREQPEAWREGHRRLYEHLKEKAKPLPETVEEMAPLYAAVVHGRQAGKNQEAVRDVFLPRIQRGDAVFNQTVLGAVGAELEMLSAFFDPPWERLALGLGEASETHVLVAAGSTLQALGRMSEAVGVLGLALRRCVARDDQKNAAVVADCLGWLCLMRGELDRALGFARQTLDFDTRGDAFKRGTQSMMLATVLLQMGRSEEAAEEFMRAEEAQAHRCPPYPLLCSVGGFHYCGLLLDRHMSTEVLQRATRTLEWAERDQQILDIALDHLSLGRAHLLALQRGCEGDISQAAAHINLAVQSLRRAGRADDLPLGFLARADLLAYTGAFLRARDDLDEALRIVSRCGFRLYEADAHLGHARLALADPAAGPAIAREHVALARRIIEATGYHRRDGELGELSARCCDA